MQLVALWFTGSLDIPNISDGFDMVTPTQPILFGRVLTLMSTEVSINHPFCGSITSQPQNSKLRNLCSWLSRSGEVIDHL